MWLVAILIFVFIFLIGYPIISKKTVEGMESSDTTTATSTEETDVNKKISDLTTRVTTLEEEVSGMNDQITGLVQEQADLATQMVGDTPITVTGTDMSA